jgi:ACS family glucarate transporter-like MFS transporter
MSVPQLIGEPRTATVTQNPGAPPTRFRWFILGLITLIMLVEALQRASFGIAGKAIQEEFQFSTQRLGVILSAFGLGQTLFQIPWGFAGDRYGPRRILTLAVLCSAVSTLFIGLTPHKAIASWFSVTALLMAWRFLGGVGMSAAPSNSNKIVSMWMATTERGTGSSAIPFGSGLGSTLAPILTVLTMQRFGWRFSYYLYAAIAVAVAIAWRFVATNRPEDHSRVNEEEVRQIRGTATNATANTGSGTGKNRLTWTEMLRSRSLWAISLSFSCQQYSIMVFQTWFFIYLIKSRGLTLTQAGFWGATPFLCMVLFSPFGGRASDFAVKRLGKRYGRRITVWVGMGLSALMLWIGSATHNNVAAIAMLAAAAGFNYFALSGFWAACIDLAPNYSASVSSLMNTCGSFGGWLAPIITAAIATHWGWPRAIACAAAVTALSGVLWIFADPSSNIEDKFKLKQTVTDAATS